MATGLTDLDGIARRADLIQESLNLNNWLLLIPPREVQFRLFIINRMANLGSVDPTEEMDKSLFSELCAFHAKFGDKHTTDSHPLE